MWPGGLFGVHLQPIIRTPKVFFRQAESGSVMWLCSSEFIQRYPDLHKGEVSQLADPLIIVFLNLLGANSEPGIAAAHLLTQVSGSSIYKLCQVEARPRLKDITELTNI